MGFKRAHTFKYRGPSIFRIAGIFGVVNKGGAAFTKGLQSVHIAAPFGFVQIPDRTPVYLVVKNDVRHKIDLHILTFCPIYVKNRKGVAKKMFKE